MQDKKTTVEQLKKRIEKFVRDRDWEQFHSPKNLSMAIAIEAAELMEHFQWHSKNQDLQKLTKSRREIEKELADIFAYLLSFSSLYDIDLTTALKKKMKINARKYPIRLARGKALKYTDYVRKP